MKKPKQQKLLLVAVEPEQYAGVAETYALSGTYGLEYLKACMEKDARLSRKYMVRIVKHSHDALDEDMADAAVEESVAVAGISLSLKNYWRGLNIARQMKLAKPDLKIVIGGPQVFDPEKILMANSFIDYAVSGEGEETFCELLQNIEIKDAGRSILGLTWRSGGKVIQNEKRPPNDKLGELPRIITRKNAAELSGVALYESSRGCRHSCTYCLWSPYTKRYFPMSRVKADLAALLKNSAISRIWFIDSDFDSDTARAAEILSYIKDNNRHGMNVSAFLSFDNPDNKLMSLVGEMFYEVPVGLQTVDAGLQKALGRGWFNLEKFEAALPQIMKYIPREKLYIDLMFGLPGEKPGDFENSISWCVSRGLTHLNFFRLGVYPGTQLFRSAPSQGIVFDEFPPHFVYGTKAMTYGDIIEIERLAVNYRILSGICGAEKLIALAKRGKLISAIKKLRRNARAWEKCFKIVDETNISDIDLSKAAALADAELKGIL